MSQIWREFEPVQTWGCFRDGVWHKVIGSQECAVACSCGEALPAAAGLELRVELRDKLTQERDGRPDGPFCEPCLQLP